jgi:CTP-dependent riboflavin kinase
VTAAEAVLLRGRVFSGKGEAAGFTALDWVRAQCGARLGFEPYAGTLNLRIEREEDLKRWTVLRVCPGIGLDGPARYCAARCYPVTIAGRIVGAIVLPLVEGYPADVVELLAPMALRQTLQLRDGDELALDADPCSG